MICRSLQEALQWAAVFLLMALVVAEERETQDMTSPLTSHIAADHVRSTVHVYILSQSSECVCGWVYVLVTLWHSHENGVHSYHNNFRLL